MRITKIITSTNWKYAVGEVLLIVIGVTIALAATSWYEDYQERIIEQETLSQIRNDLEEKRHLLNNRLTLHKNQSENIKAIVDFIDSDDQTTVNQRAMFREVARFYGMTLDTSVYEVLKSRGLDLITDKEVRSSLVDFYENTYPNVHATYLNDREISISQIMPFFNQYFIGNVEEDWIPKDINLIREEGYFRNMCITKLIRLNNYSIPFHEAALEEIDNILSIF